MNRKNSPDNKRILLDTSFLLPILGFETSRRVMNAFHRLGSYELYYNDISILEALWKIVKVIEGRKDQVSRIVEGLRAVRDTMKYAPIDGEAAANALYMYNLGHRDVIDNLLYSISLSGRLKLLTIDEELAEFVEKHNLPRDPIITPEQLDRL